MKSKPAAAKVLDCSGLQQTPIDIRIYDLRFTIYNLQFTIYDLQFEICDLR